MKWPTIFSVAGIDPRPLTTHNYPSLSLSQAWLWCPGFGRSRGSAWRRLTAWFLKAKQQMPEGPSKANQRLPAVPRPPYSLKIRTNIHCGILALEETKKTKGGVGGWCSWLLKSIYLFKKHVLSTRHWQGCSDMIPIECFGDSISSMFWSCSVASTGVFSSKMLLLRAGNIIEAPGKGSGSLGSALSYSLSPAPLCPPCHLPHIHRAAHPQIPACFSAPSVLWPNIAESTPVTSVNILPRSLLAGDFEFVRHFFLSSKLLCCCSVT